MQDKPIFIGQINDLAAKLDSWDTNSGRGGYSLNQEGVDKKAEDKLGKATKDSCKITTEVLHGIMTQVSPYYFVTNHKISYNQYRHLI